MTALSSVIGIGILFLGGCHCYTASARPRGNPSNGGPSFATECSNSNIPTKKRRQCSVFSKPQIDDDDFEEVSFSKIKGFTKRLLRGRKEPGTLLLVS